jgi:hypothetical protein
VTYATANGFDPSLANYAYVFLALLIATSTQLTYSLAICNGCSILGRIFPLIAAQKVGPINTLILFSFTSAIMLFVWTRATDIPGILTYDAFYGISSGKLSSSWQRGLLTVQEHMLHPSTLVLRVLLLTPINLGESPSLKQERC